MNVSRIWWKYSFFSLLLFVAGVAEKLCTAFSDLYPRWKRGDRLGGVLLAGVQSIHTQRVKLHYKRYHPVDQKGVGEPLKGEAIR